MTVQSSSRVPDISQFSTPDAAARQAATNPLGTLQSLVQYERERQASNGTPTMGSITTATVTNAITAHAGGTQAGGVPLTTSINRVTVVASAGDSVTLPVSRAGLRMTVINTTATSMNVFPNAGGTTTEAINAVAANGAFALATLKSVEFICAVAGTWNTLPWAP